MLAGQIAHSASVSGLGESPDRWSSRRDDDVQSPTAQPTTRRRASDGGGFPRREPTVTVRMGEGEASSTHRASRHVASRFPPLPVCRGVQRRNQSLACDQRRRTSPRASSSTSATCSCSTRCRSRSPRYGISAVLGSEWLGQEHASAPDQRPDRAGQRADPHRWPAGRATPTSASALSSRSRACCRGARRSTTSRSRSSWPASRGARGANAREPCSSSSA